MREPDACVSCCAFDYCSAGPEEAFFFGILHHVERCSVFDAASGVLEFRFSENFTARFF